MNRSDAKKRFDGLSQQFEAEFSPEILGETALRIAWMERARRLTSDVFGPQDGLYSEFEKCVNLSSTYESVDAHDKKTVGRQWFGDVDQWLDKLEVSIDVSDVLSDEKFYQTRLFTLTYPLISALVAVLVTLYFSSKQFDSEQALIDSRIEQENKIELAGVMAEFEFWVKGVPLDQADSVRAITSDFNRRGMIQHGPYVLVLTEWARRKRFSIDSARTSYFAQINALGGDTLSLKAPHKLSFDLMGHFKRMGLTRNLHAYGVDTL